MREIQLANLTFHPEFRKLIGPKKTEILRPKVAKLLNLLIHHFPKVVSKAACLEKLWPDTHVEQRALAQVVAELRKSFDQVGGDRAWIENIPKGGYCLAIDPVEMSVRRPLPPLGAKSVVREPQTPKTKPWRRGLVIALPLLSLVLAGWWFLQRGDSQPADKVRLGVLPITGTSDEGSEWLRYAYPDLLTDALSNSKQIEVASFEEVYQNFQRLDTKGTDLEGWSASPLKQSLGINAAAQVGIQSQDGQLEFEVTLLRGENKTVFKFKSSDPSSTIESVAERILQALDVEELPPSPFETGFLSEAYARGLDAFLKGEHKQAQPYFLVCFDQFPQFGRHAFYLASTYLFLRDYESLEKLMQHPDVPETDDWQFLKAKILYAKRDFPASDAALTALVEAEQTPRHILAEAHHFLGMIRIRQERFFIGQEHFETSATIFREMGNLSSLVTTSISQLKTKQYFGLEMGVDRWEELIDLAQLVQNRSIESRALIGMGDHYYYQEAWQKAFDCYAASLELRRELSDQLGVGIALSSMGSTATMQRDFAKAEPLLLQALQVNIELKDPYNQANQYLNLANVYLGQSLWDKAADYFQTMIDHCREQQDQSGVLIGQTGLIEVALFRGDYALAESLIDRAEQQETMTARMRAQLKCYRASMVYKQGRVDEALALMKEVDMINEGRPLSAIVKKYLDIYQNAAETQQYQALPFEADPLHAPVL